MLDENLIELVTENVIKLLKDKDGIIALYKRENSGVYSCVRGLR